MESDVSSSKKPCRREEIENTSTGDSANYDVFISHRGLDTKTGFVGYLRRDLEAAGLQIFLDCRSIEKGEDKDEDIWESIEPAIKNSRIAVVVFSEYFAASEWCLKELDLMLNTPGVKVLPIFYNVRPSEVRHPESSKNKKLNDDFKELCEGVDKTIIERWRERLQEASEIPGWICPPECERLEAEMLSEIVGKILALANKPLLSDAGGYVVGVKQVAEEIIQILENKKEVLILGLWGMGGIGKSTLARELYNKMSTRYDSTCYIEDVTEEVTKGGVVKIQQYILKDLCTSNSEDIVGKSMGKTILEESLCKKRFLLVLDNVRDKDQMEYWISRKMFAKGSMCIVTSRDKRIFEMLPSFEVELEVHIHDVQGLSTKDSEQWLVTYAFEGHRRIESGFEQLLSGISKGCGGVPLVLKVCGDYLKGKDNVDEWRKVLANLNDGVVMDEKIFECFRTSYDDLSLVQQEMFLDIACALIGRRKQYAVKVWKSLQWPVELGIITLVEKALIIVDEKGYLKMHDHLRNMGWEIVRKKRASEGIIKRLWMPEAFSLVCNEQLPDSIQTLVLSVDGVDVDNIKDQVINLDVSNMKDLRILMCDGFINILSPLPSGIRWVQHASETHGYVNFPITYSDSKLTLLELKNSKIESVPNTLVKASNLEVLNLNSCVNLSTLPNSFGSLKKMQQLKLDGSKIENLPESFGELHNLEVLSLIKCINLLTLPDSIKGLKKMRVLMLNDSGIQNLPESFGKLSNLEELDLSECSKLFMLPISFGRLEKMRVLMLKNSGIKNLPESFGELSKLEVLVLSSCRNLSTLPDTFGGLKKMRELKLNYSGIMSLPESFGELSNLEVLVLTTCRNLSRLPDTFGGLKKMRVLKLDGSRIMSLPESFGELHNLEVLSMSWCRYLSKLPDSFGGLKKMQELNLNSSVIVCWPESFGELHNLEVLSLINCQKLLTLPDSVKGLKKMRELKLDGSEIENLPESFGELHNLEVLSLSRCKSLFMLPESIKGLKKMRELKLVASGIQSLPESFGELNNLEVLDLSLCVNISKLPNSFGSLKRMRQLKLDSSKIESLQESFGELHNLEVLYLNWCVYLSKLPNSFGSLKKMQELKLSSPRIENLPESFGELINLEVLDLNSCVNISKLPNSFGGLKKMRQLKLDGLKIENLPESFGELSNLEELDLSSNIYFQKLPNSFGSLKKMQKLKLDGSGIQNLPESFGELCNLEELDLSECSKLFMLPESFGRLEKMRVLMLKNSGIKNLPESFGELSNLEVLILSSCKYLSRLPDTFGGLKKMRELKLDDSGIMSLPESFGELHNLKVLSLSLCMYLSKLPNSFGGLKKMQKLKLDGSKIESFPKSFKELHNLEVLDMSWCDKLFKLPDSFGGLMKMRELKLRSSRIENLPDSFGKLSNLEVLDLSSCVNLSNLPDSFGGLKKMQELKLDSSGIQSLPESFGELSTLEKLGLKECSKLFMLPKSFGSLEKMRELTLSYSEIRSLPESFGKLRLSHLGLTNCSHLTMLFSNGKFLSNLHSRNLPSIRLLGKGLASIGYETKWVNGVRYARKDFVGVPSNIFQKEADMLVKLKVHQNVVKTHGLTVDKLSCSLVLEYMDDKLSGLLQKSKDQRKRTAPTGTDSGNQSDQNHALLFELKEALDLMLQIARGLEHIHNQGVIHGDLKTRNILVNYKTNGGENLSVEVVKVADFGLVLTKRNSMSYASRQVCKLDMVRWKAPEILTMLLSEAALSESDSDLDEECTGSGTVEKPADVYSFALICFQILTGEEPYPQRKWKGMVKDIVSGELRPKLPSDPPCPEILSELLISCWDSDPRKRPPFSSIRKKLEHIHTLPKLTVKDKQEQKQNAPDSAVLSRKGKGLMPEYVELKESTSNVPSRTGEGEKFKEIQDLIQTESKPDDAGPRDQFRYSKYHRMKSFFKPVSRLFSTSQ